MEKVEIFPTVTWSAGAGCHGNCGQKLYVKNGELIRVEGDEDHPAFLYLDMVKDVHVPPQPEILESPAQAHGGDEVGRKPGDFPALKNDLAPGGLVYSGQQIEDGGLPGSVGTDQTSDLARLNLQIVIVYGS